MHTKASTVPAHAFTNRFHVAPMCLAISSSDTSFINFKKNLITNSTRQRVQKKIITTKIKQQSIYVVQNVE